MATVQSFGTLQTYTPTPRQSSAVRVESVGSGRLFRAEPATYAALYRTQPSVRTVVEFIARNLAELSVHAYRRVSDTDRERLYGYELLQWLGDPNPATGRYQLIDGTMQDLGIYWNAYWLKVRREDSLGLVRLPPETVTPEGWLLPRGYYWTLPDGNVVELSSRDLVVFRGYNPDDPCSGLSPLETLRRRLAEESAQGSYRTAYFNNAARTEGIIMRPPTAPKWTPEQKQSFRDQWQMRYAGPNNAGQTPVLEDGMTYAATSYSARDSEFNDTRKLTREEVASSYHVPLPMVGILEHATFSNIREQHKNLYQDCLGPWLKFLQEILMKQLMLTDCDDVKDVYLEFNIAEKMKGSFEEQGESLQRLVGRPIMTPNEGRARLNLPSIKNDASADQLAMPLNTSTNNAMAPPPGTRISGETFAPVVQAFWARQRARLEKVHPAARAATFDMTRWDRELAYVLEPLYRAAGYGDEAGIKADAHAHSINVGTLHLLASGHHDPFNAAREAALYGQA